MQLKVLKDNPMGLIRIIILFSILFMGCNPFTTPELRKKARLEKKFNRILKNNPSLRDSITITVYDTITIDSIHIDTTIALNADVSGVDTLFKHYAVLFSKLDSRGTREFKTVIKNYITERPMLIDTTVVEIDSGLYMITIYQGEGGLKVTYTKRKQVLTTEKDVEVPVIAPPDLSTSERIILFIEHRWTEILIFLIVLMMLLYTRKVLKKYFPFIP